MSVQASTWAIEQTCATPTEKAVLLVIANYAGPDGACYPGQETIARQACCSVKSVERALAVFEERGWITRQHRQRRDGSRTSDLIHFSIAPNPEPLDQPDTVSPRRKPTRQPVQSNPTPCPIQPDTVSGLTTFEPLGEPLGEVVCVERASLDGGFERFWSAYPVKVAKPAARKAFAKARPKVADVEVLIAAVERQRDWDAWQRGFIPHPATWLNQERWNDEQPQPPKAHVQSRQDRPQSRRDEDLGTMLSGAMVALDRRAAGVG